MKTEKRLIPWYFVNRRNTVWQILFTTLFALVFINIYRPFDAGNWYEVTWYQFLYFSALLVLAGMLVVVVSRVIMLRVKKGRPITLVYYLLMIAGEIMFMAAMFALVEKVWLNDGRSFALLWYLALQNTALILLIPYLISLLFFAWRAKSLSFKNLLSRYRHEDRFLSFHDHKGHLEYSVKTTDVLYLESDDNYVIIHYLAGEKKSQLLLRNSLKYFEEAFKLEPFLRCHRSYMVNVQHVTLVKRSRNQLQLLLDNDSQAIIPVSKSYEQAVKGFFE
jgi:hypothetical protein